MTYLSKRRSSLVLPINHGPNKELHKSQLINLSNAGIAPKYSEHICAKTPLPLQLNKIYTIVLQIQGEKFVKNRARSTHLPTS